MGVSIAYLRAVRLQMILPICSLEIRQIRVCQYKPQVKGISFAYLRAVELRMSLADLQPGNFKRARETAVKAFLRFLQSENANLVCAKGCIQRGFFESGQCFVSVMDKFGMHLAFHQGRAGKPLAIHSCMQYYRQTKHWC